jgi:hypothetical protein
LLNITQLIRLRTIIGYLGEKEQYNWWSSTFFSAPSSAFLAPVFTRTQSLARLSGVSRAAARVHDEFIGVGAVYHLFRLPEQLEQRIVVHLQQEPEQKGASVTKEEALTWLHQYAASTPVTTMGPVHVGNIEQLQLEASWQEVAALYLYAFQMNTRLYPYFRDTAK